MFERFSVSVYAVKEVKSIQQWVLWNLSSVEVRKSWTRSHWYYIRLQFHCVKYHSVQHQECRPERLFKCTVWQTGTFLWPEQTPKKRQFHCVWEKWLCEVFFNRLLYDTVVDLAWIVKAQQHEISNIPLEIVTRTKLGQVLSQGKYWVQSPCSTFLRTRLKGEWMGRMGTCRMTWHRLSPGSLLFGLWTVAVGFQCLFAFSNTTRCVASLRVRWYLPHRKILTK